MANKASDNVFQLIKSMSKPEKRYFKVYISRHTVGEKNNNDLLFNTMDKMDEYDEEWILKKYKKEEFTHRFSITKSRLYQAILKSLDQYYSANSIEIQVRKQIHFVEILYRKSLYGQANKLLRSVKKQAQKHELTTALIDIGKWEKRFMERGNYENVKESEIEKVWNEDLELMEDVHSSAILWNVKSKVFQKLYEKGKVRSKEEMQKFKSLIDVNVEELEKTSLSTNNMYLLQHLYSAFYFASGNYKESYSYLKKNIELIESKMSVFSSEPNIYLSVLTNAIHLSTVLNKKEEGMEYLMKLREMPKQYKDDWSEDLEIRFFAISKSAELTFYIENNEIDKGLLLVPEIRHGLKNHEGKISSVRRGFFFFGIANLYFAKGEYHDALNWINKLLNDVGIDISTDVHCMALLFNIVLHIELENEDHLPYTLRSTERFLSTRKKAYKFENLFLQFVRDFMKKRNSKDKVKLYQSLASESSKLKSSPFESRVYEYFDFHKWAEKKAQETEFID